MGVALKRLSGWPNIAEIFVIDNKILDDEGILKNIKLQFLPKMGVVSGVTTAPATPAMQGAAP